MRGSIGKTTRPAVSQCSKPCCTLLANDAYTWHFCPCTLRKDRQSQGLPGPILCIYKVFFCFRVYFSAECRPHLSSVGVVVFKSYFQGTNRDYLAADLGAPFQHCHKSVPVDLKAVLHPSLFLHFPPPQWEVQQCVKTGTVFISVQQGFSGQMLAGDVRAAYFLGNSSQRIILKQRYWSRSL